MTPRHTPSPAPGAEPDDAQAGAGLRDDPDGCDLGAELLKAIAHPLRLRIVAILCEGEQQVGALAARLGAPQAIVSQQLRLLRMRELVKANRSNGHARYHLAEVRLRRVILCLEGCVRERRGGGRS
ncbi:MAG TPA: metalloregulator ArsR/SmtB family transcription factor [Myxococcota bacterium]|nr:metalloregulator ArsR/SmtB family transcription factor [Myxococcota bacterium]HRY92000.1 metalloregulator ArsR/SmtB family transcription factor [Myxococcota bacterium]HSA22675.1 metalloregulator ArsR/SmtB family transcription factor [Myxococcota bacterium]